MVDRRERKGYCQCYVLLPGASRTKQVGSNKPTGLASHEGPLGGLNGVRVVLCTWLRLALIREFRFPLRIVSARCLCKTETLQTVVARIAFPSFVKQECVRHVLPRERRGGERSGRELECFRFKHCGCQTSTRKEHRYGWKLRPVNGVGLVFSAGLDIRAQERSSGSCEGRSESYARTRGLVAGYDGCGRLVRCRKYVRDSSRFT